MENTNLKVGIYTMELYENRQKNSVGSSRIRGTWIVNNWPDAELFKIGKKYDAVIFQKSYFVRFMKVFPGIKILDMCDPDWLEGRPVKECIDLCDAVTTSSEALAEFIRKMTDKPVICVPDRMDMKEHPDKKVHEGPARNVVWFGYSTNQKVLDSAVAAIKRLGLGLTVISDMPYYPSSGIADIDDVWFKTNVRNIKYDANTINEDILRGGDIIINPKLDVGRFKYKSNNKTLTAWALGMPVAEDSEDLERFMDPEERRKEADLRMKEVLEKWTIDKSVNQYRDIIKMIAESKNGK